MNDDVLDRLQQKRYALANAETFLREMREIRDDLSERGVYSIAHNESWTGGTVKVCIIVKVPDGAALPVDVFKQPEHEWDTAKVVADRTPSVVTLEAEYTTRVNDSSEEAPYLPGHPCEAA